MEATLSIAEAAATRNTRSRGLMLSGHQPVYLPGIILLNKIALSDIFMFVGHCQYVKKSWHSRNRIALRNQELWLSVPVKTAGLFEQAINDTYPANEVWKRKHLGSIRQAYCKARFFELYYPELEHTLVSNSGSLGDLNVSLIKMMLRWLKITTPILDSRDYEIHGNKTEMLISMCRSVGAVAYLSNGGAKTYVEEDRMENAGLGHHWQEFDHPVYLPEEQFMPNLSAIDLLFHRGLESREIVLSCGRVGAGQFAEQRQGA